MPPEAALPGAERIVAYLPTATDTLATLDDRQFGGITQSIEVFLANPGDTFDKFPRESLGHVRDIPTDMRAFATWCQNESIGAELCVVHQVYRKINEKHFWVNLDAVNSEGEFFVGMFEDLSRADYDDWRAAVGSHDEYRIVE